MCGHSPSGCDFQITLPTGALVTEVLGERDTVRGDPNRFEVFSGLDLRFYSIERGRFPDLLDRPFSPLFLTPPHR